MQVLPLQEGAESRDKLLPRASRREPSATARYHPRMAVAKSWSICLRDKPLQMDTQMFLPFPAGFTEEHVQRGRVSRAALQHPGAAHRSAQGSGTWRAGALWVTPGCKKEVDPVEGLTQTSWSWSLLHGGGQ